MTLTVGSLFSGIGGFDLGFEKAGMEIRWQVEIDEFCQKVLKKHWPNVERFDDIKNIQELPYVDLICGGFPCQPVSTCGRHKGDEDERWLWPEFYRIVCMVKPEWIVVENAAGLLSAKNGQLFGGILANLAQSGYDAEWQVFSASQFGLPHIRKRLFLVAYSNSKRLHKNIFSKKSYLQYDKERYKLSNDSSIYIDVFKRSYPNISDYIREANGISSKLDKFRKERIKSLGNSIVPTIVEYIGKSIINSTNDY